MPDSLRIQRDWRDRFQNTMRAIQFQNFTVFGSFLPLRTACSSAAFTTQSMPMKPPLTRCSAPLPLQQRTLPSSPECSRALFNFQLWHSLPPDQLLSSRGSHQSSFFVEPFVSTSSPILLFPFTLPSTPPRWATSDCLSYLQRQGWLVFVEYFVEQLFESKTDWFSIWQDQGQGSSSK